MCGCLDFCILQALEICDSCLSQLGNFSIAGMITEAEAFRTVCLLSPFEGKDFFKSSELRKYVFFFDI